VRVFVRARAAFAFSLPNEVFLSIFPGEKILHFSLDMFPPSSTASSRATPSKSPLLLREGKRREQRQRRLFFFSARNDGKTSASSSSRASFLTAAARGGEEKNGNEDDGIEEATKTKRKSLVAATTSAATMMMTTTTTTTTAFACEEAVSSLAEGTNGTLESVRLVVALSSIALILFQGPKGDGVVNTLSEKRVFSSAKNAKSAVDYVTYALIGGFIVLSAVLAVG